MTSIDWNRIREEKELHRANSAALPFEEKLRILDRLRERDRAFRGIRRHFGDQGRGPSAGYLQTGISHQSSGAIRLIVFGANTALLAAAGLAGTRR